MEKEFVPYEQALALKELGFDEPCLGYYVTVEVPNPFLVTTKISDTQGGYFTFAPLYQQAFRWSREKHQLKVEPLYWYEGSELVYFVYIGRKDASKKGTNYGFNTRPYKINVKSYEEAELVCIDKLIEILKERQHENIK